MNDDQLALDRLGLAQTNAKARGGAPGGGGEGGRELGESGELGELELGRLEEGRGAKQVTSPPVHDNDSSPDCACVRVRCIPMHRCK